MDRSFLFQVLTLPSSYSISHSHPHPHDKFPDLISQSLRLSRDDETRWKPFKGSEARRRAGEMQCTWGDVGRGEGRTGNGAKSEGDGIGGKVVVNLEKGGREGLVNENKRGKEGDAGK